MSRQSRQLLLSYATAHIKGAFLQGAKGEEKRKIYAWPVEELADALAVPRDQPVQLLKACYGLVNVTSFRSDVLKGSKTIIFTKMVQKRLCSHGWI